MLFSGTLQSLLDHVYHLPAMATTLGNPFVAMLMQLHLEALTAGKREASEFKLCRLYGQGAGHGEGIRERPGNREGRTGTLVRK